MSDFFFLELGEKNPNSETFFFCFCFCSVALIVFCRSLLDYTKLSLGLPVCPKRTQDDDSDGTLVGFMRKHMVVVLAMLQPVALG